MVLDDMTCRDQGMVYRKNTHIVLESSRLQVAIDPENQGRIRSFKSKRTGREYFFVDPRNEFHGPGYSDHDISGYTECFPTVGQCDYPNGKYEGLDMGDHGCLWQEQWRTEIEADKVIMACHLPQFECYFDRTCHLEEDDCLRLDYTITNDGNEPFKCIYAAHMLLYGDAQTRLEFPDEMSEVFVQFASNVAGVADKTWIQWPPPGASGLNGPFSVERGSAAKLFSRKLSEGKAAIRHTDIEETLQVEFDLPHLGILISQGYDSPYEGIKSSIILGLEPTTGIGDELPTCECTGSVLRIEPRGEMSFWIRLTLRDERARR
ncbi:MAG: hypothetical protein A2Z18_01470 [Armatimonadetes bacterium RBG_16_58_9]|nr:MAG: hypothetical protein A2Z18_01470 [Armatimonadetes bacterium RBG_16_58_9]